MFSHIHLGTTDIERAVKFYDSVLEPLGIVRKFLDKDHGWAGWKLPDEARPLFLVGRPFKGVHSVGNGQMVAFQAANREQVDRCYAMALSEGADDSGAPGLRPEYHPDYYGAYFRDLDDNKICVCCHVLV